MIADRAHFRGGSEEESSKSGGAYRSPVGTISRRGCNRLIACVRRPDKQPSHWPGRAAQSLGISAFFRDVVHLTNREATLSSSNSLPKAGRPKNSPVVQRC